MKRRSMLMLAAPLAVLAAQPALAADDFRELGAPPSHRAGFAGLQLRMNLGDARPAAPTARFTMGVTHYSQNGHSLQRGNYMSSVELGFSGRGRANLYVAGQRLSDMQQRLGIAPAAAALIGVAAVGVGVLAVSAMDDDLHRVQCLLPEKELCGPQ